MSRKRGGARAQAGAIFCALLLATFLADGQTAPARARQRSNGGRLHVGVERLFGVSLYSQHNRTQSDFGDFIATHQGVGVHLFGVNVARGDGDDGKNLSAMPRLFVDHEWDNRWSVGGMVGATYSAGRRKVQSGDSDLDPYDYPSQLAAVVGVRVGRVFAPKGRFHCALLAGPGLAYELIWGGGATFRSLSFQLNLQAPFFFEALPGAQIFLSPYADLGLWGVTSEKLNVEGVPETVVRGNSYRYAVGLAGGLQFSF